MTEIVSWNRYSSCLAHQIRLSGFFTCVNKAYLNYLYSKTCVKQPLSKRPKIGFQDQLSLNAGKIIAECSKGRSLFCLFLSGCFTQFLLYKIVDSCDGFL